jgi:urease beta subunit
LEPGEYFLKKEPILINACRKTRTIQVVNRGDRLIFVGSHYHFYEADPGLDFDRNLTLGMRLNILSGEAEQFPPGEMKVVELVEIGGKKEVFGFRGYVNGPVPPCKISLYKWENDLSETICYEIWPNEG